jgi:hypothetical protein
MTLPQLVLSAVAVAAAVLVKCWEQGARGDNRAASMSSPVSCGLLGRYLCCNTRYLCLHNTPAPAARIRLPAEPIKRSLGRATHLHVDIPLHARSWV